MSKNTFLISSQDIFLSGLNTALTRQEILYLKKNKKSLLPLSRLFYLTLVSSSTFSSEKLIACTSINDKRQILILLLYLHMLCFFPVPFISFQQKINSLNILKMISSGVFSFFHARVSLLRRRIMGPDCQGPPIRIFKMGKKQAECCQNIILHWVYPSVIHFAAAD